MSTQIALPRDAEGREIPLDTEVLYNKDGNELCTDSVTYMRLTKDWWFFGHFRSCTDTHSIAASNLYLTPPDSWDKLEQDALKNPCEYFGRRDDFDSAWCDGCPAENGSCCKTKSIDLIRRAKALGTSRAQCAATRNATSSGAECDDRQQETV